MSTFTTNKNMIHDDLCIATRIHSMPKNTTSFKNDLKTFIENGITYSNAILIAVKANIADFRDNHNENNLYKVSMSVVANLPRDIETKITILPILDWGVFTTALNTLLLRAGKMKGMKYILYKSFEVRISQEDVNILRNELKFGDTLVAGGRLECHDFKSICNQHQDTLRSRRSNYITNINGRTVPWNTCAMWNIRLLSKTGFQMISDGLISGHGVEEVVTISVLQQLHEDNEAKAKLLELKSIVWKTKFENNIGRQIAHRKKMISKLNRAESQMKHFSNLNPGTVEHVQYQKKARYDNIQIGFKWGEDSSSSSEEKKMEVENTTMRNAMAHLEEIPRVIKATIPKNDSFDSIRQIDEYVEVGTSESESDEEKKETKQQHSSYPSKAILNMTSCVGNGKTILLTGGAGFIGSHTCAELLKRGDNVVVVDEVNDYYDVSRKKNNLEWLKKISLKSKGYFEFIKADICDNVAMETAFERYQPTHIIHLAARAGVRASINDPLTYVHSNVRGTTTLLELAKKYKCKHFVYASSSSVYGGSENEVFRESDVVNAPVSPYAATKKACELLASTYTHLYQLPTAGLRFFTVYGPRGRPDMAPYKFLHRIFNDITIDQYGDGTSERDYTYVGDIVDGVIRACDRPLGCQVYNLGNGRPISLKRFIQIASTCAGKNVKINVLPMQPGDVPRTCADISKASKLLGYRPKVKFEDGMKITANWYRSTFM